MEFLEYEYEIYIQDSRSQLFIYISKFTLIYNNYIFLKIQKMTTEDSYLLCIVLLIRWTFDCLSAQIEMSGYVVLRILYK